MPRNKGTKLDLTDMEVAGSGPSLPKGPAERDENDDGAFRRHRRNENQGGYGDRGGRSGGYGDREGGGGGRFGGGGGGGDREDGGYGGGAPEDDGPWKRGGGGGFR
eukprot:CAMPEP_0185752790 /NCGR_PEP_ID=MMETSP1174-20130828/11572_1 /TAXON_ID=35687 /ORGANISM="Dictyocha speculum, Strain CCMP1381" /LENGTH=105 /DNA_ID=CAMNT_0028430373 /DNA_START=50 /DNA_END=364 /DNA_ORIENTATION=-